MTAGTDRPLTFDREYTALFASMWGRVSVFHAFGETNRKKDDDPDLSADYTRCGMLVSSYHHDTGKLTDQMTWIPIRHALAFGLPCRKCFPSGGAA